MRDTDVLRGFRSTDIRNLAKAALDQGWDGYVNGSGHVQLVNPANGLRVSLSTTAASSHRGHTLANARAAMRRAGLILDPKASRPARSPEEVPMDTTEPQAEAPEAEAPEAIRHDPVKTRDYRPGGGKFALDGDTEVVLIGAYRVTVNQRVDGVWMARTPDDSRASGTRQWAEATDRTTLLGRVTRDLEEQPPTLGTRERRGATKIHVEATLAALAEAAAVSSSTESPIPDALPPFVAARIPERLTNGADHGTAWRAVGVDPAEFPLAVGLDGLHAAMVPALEALEAAGRTDSAALIRSELETTPVEAELLRLWRLVIRGG